jgi:predicted metal-dependent phosphoesterase TrpH
LTQFPRERIFYVTTFGPITMIDLHVHTTNSDGTLTPGEVVSLAAATGLRAIAITDHDTVAGVGEAQRAGTQVGLEVVSGVEISAQSDRGILHILGYFVRPDHSELIEVLDTLRQGREERTPKILTKLRGLKLAVSLQEVNEEAAGGVPGRPHIARVLKRKNYVRTLQEAFDRYLKKGAAAYVPKRKLQPDEALRIIKSAGGIPVMAHPYSLLGKGAGSLETLIKRFIPLGLRGIEAYYPKHTPEQTELFLELGRKYGLLITGGTDFHGANKPDIELGVIPGNSPLPYSLLESLKEARERREDIGEVGWLCS